ncbi:hypothetical protein [Diaphorobacter caeni]|uniref:hypothetical protein n=1 Tax=Diaphorobacter caeni TaxID=2784387 RepID=UPI00188E0DD1|nr:hypothetical protein [Diaphorobacter caeni]MBF5006410.1 hypothetical protein [Diaphorobacter caeni]
MQNGWNFVWTVIASSAGSAALLAIVAGLGKAQIAHWLNKDIEAIKAQHQRDLESYKTMLIAQAEAIKANQEVKKVVAVRLAEMRLDAISGIQNNLAPMSVMLGMIRSMQQSKLQPPYKDFLGAGAKLHAAITSAKPFLRPDYHESLITYANAFTQGVQNLARTQTQPNALDGGATDILDELFSRHGYCEMRLYEYLHSMAEMD